MQELEEDRLRLNRKSFSVQTKGVQQWNWLPRKVNLM